ncbi:protein-disulfide reductase DsbD [Duganella vulcania]|uniref:Thiol:disulfide interchange protein DsbD n=1 Tax=Duganella vulcania TaxID=2692166 RepID=A0A845GU50_9BURK|nr:protein-disulfide reductase DsbD [Duganella vulcania]MYM97275.1 protein-disulfide reductase DsbD [Duganella vulcania]
MLRIARLFLPLLSLIALLMARPALADDGFLEPDVAFKFSARMVDGHTLSVSFQIADGYYMYRERFKFSASGARLGALSIPAGTVHFDETFQKNVETYRKSVTMTMPVEGDGPFTLVAVGQGCSDKGLCYAPQEYKASLVGSGSVPLPGGTAGAAASTAAGSQATARTAVPIQAATPAAPSAAVGEGKPAAQTPGVTIRAIPEPVTTVLPPLTAPTAATAPADEASRWEAALRTGSLTIILPLFLVLGLGLSFTPCVLPMVPILSSIIVGEGAQSSRSRGLMLSSAYSLGMAIVYTGLGVAAGFAGEGLAAQFQNPWVLGTFALLMALLSLSMFGYYELQVPAVFQSRLSSVSNRQSAGKLAGVFVMGMISALIVGPCVGPALLGILVFISGSHDAVLGGAALFAMAVGMSVPLLLVGVSAGALLPRAGAWMDAVKRFFGVMLLAVGWWLVSPVLPPAVQMVGWAVLLTGYGVYLLAHHGKWVAKSAGVVAAVLGLVQLVGVASGGRDPLAPLAHLGAKHETLPFQRIKTVQQLDALLAQTGGRTVMLDFYADWCVSCKEMEKLTFVDPQVRAKLANSLLLQVDVTANDADDKAMLKRFGLFGPPGIILFDKQGREIDGARVIGFQDAAKFTASLSRLN